MINQIYKTLQFFLRKIKSISKNKKGFLFIETIVLIIVIGIIIGVMIKNINFYKKYQAEKKTQENIKIVTLALSLYFKTQKYIPRPLEGQVCGKIPYNKLGISEDFTKNGYGHFFTYIINPDYLIASNHKLEILEKEESKPIINTISSFKTTTNTNLKQAYMSDQRLKNIPKVECEHTKNNKNAFVIIDHGEFGEGSFKNQNVSNNNFVNNTSENLNEINKAYTLQVNKIHLKKHENFKTTNPSHMKVYFNSVNLIIIYASNF